MVGEIDLSFLLRTWVQVEKNAAFPSDVRECKLMSSYLHPLHQVILCHSLMIRI